MKRKLREKYRKVRLGMSFDDVEAKSKVICQKLFEDISWRTIKSICAFNPIPSFNEIDIYPLLKALSESYPHLKINIIGQSKDQKIPTKEFDIILVPALAFDEYNFRLGWGGGFYDKFLARQPQALKIRICFQNGFAQERLPHEAHDIPLDKIVTETSIISRHVN